MNINTLLEQSKSIAVIGVTPNKEKFSYQIFKRLIKKGYKTYGVSPLYDSVEQYPLYPNLSSIHEPIDFVVFVVNKKFALPYIEEMAQLKIPYAWMQPNTYDAQLLETIKEKDITPYLACILEETNT